MDKSIKCIRCKEVFLVEDEDVADCPNYGLEILKFDIIYQ